MKWERPDWEVASQYPDLESTPLNQWAWEFLRRNPEYCSDFDRYYSEVAKKARSLFMGLTNKEDYQNIVNSDVADKLHRLSATISEFDESLPLQSIIVEPRALEDESLGEWISRSGGEWQKMGYPSLYFSAEWFGGDKSFVTPPNPSHSDAWKEGSLYDEGIIFWGGPNFYPVNYELPEEFRQLSQAKDAASSDEEAKKIEDKLDKIQEVLKTGENENWSYKQINIKPSGFNELYMELDVSLPFDMQMKQARAIFMRERERYEGRGGKLFEKRKMNKKPKYQDYIRILDAYLTGASTVNIASVLYPEEENTHDTGFSVSHKVRVNYKAAQKFRDQDFKSLALIMQKPSAEVDPIFRTVR